MRILSDIVASQSSKKNKKNRKKRKIAPVTTSGIAKEEETFPLTGSIMISPMMKEHVERKKTKERMLIKTALVFFDILAMANIAFITIPITFYLQISDSSSSKKKRYLKVSILFAFGAPDGIQTHGPRLRRPVLYPLSYGRLGMALPKGFEPLAYRLGGGRSIQAELREQRIDYITIFSFPS